MVRKLAIGTAIAFLASSTMLADFSYQETSTITGGAMASMMKVVGVFSKQAREPIHSTVAFKGDMMVHRSNNHIEIIDLASQTITSVDLQKKTYTVMTFEQMKQMLDQLSQKMQQQKDSGKGEVNWKVSASATGNSKQIAGFDAKEMLMKMEMEGTDQQSGQKGSMVVTTHVWIATVPGSQESRDFYKRMSEKLNWTPGGNMFMSRPDMAKGMAEAAKEIAKLNGTPVLQTMSMGAEGAAPAGAEGQTAAQPAPQPQQQQQQAERPSLGGALGGALGGHFGLGRRKPKDQPKEQQEAPANAQRAGRHPRFSHRHDDRVFRLLLGARRCFPVRCSSRVQEGRTRHETHAVASHLFFDGAFRFGSHFFHGLRDLRFQFVVKGIRRVHHLQRPLVERQRFGLVPCGELFARGRRKAGRQEVRADRNGLVLGILRLIVLLLIGVEDRNLVERQRHHGMVRAERLDPQGEQPLVQRLGLIVLLLPETGVGQPVQGPDQIGILAAYRRLADHQGVPVSGLGLIVLAQGIFGASHPVQIRQ